MRNIKELVNQILSERHCSFSDDDYFNMDSEYEGILDREELSSVIKLTVGQKEFEPLLCQLVAKFINADSVDRNNFEALLNYKGKCRKTLLWNLCEVPLSFCQMQVLFNKFSKRYPEIVCNIITVIYKNACFNEYDLEFYLDKCSDIDVKSVMDIAGLLASVPTNSKTKLLSAYL